MRGQALNNLHAFKRLCGEDFFSNILLGTNFWRNVTLAGKRLADAREAELKTTDDFWKKMISGGAKVSRIPDTRTKALELLMQMAAKKTSVLRVQSEAVDQGVSFENTVAHQALNERLSKARIEHQRAKDRLAEETRIAREKREAEAARARAENQRRLEEEKRKLEIQQEAQARALEEHRMRMAAMREEQERARQRERDLELSMQRLQIVSTRKDKRAKWEREVQSQLWLVENSSSTNSGLFRQVIMAYNLMCDNCMEQIGAGTYYRKCSVYSAARHSI
jgi:hypothetical protein